MKYRINDSYQDNSIDIITEDGGIACVYHNGENLVTHYYQTKLTDISKDNYVWDELSNGSIYCNDWDGEPTRDEIVSDALSWLASSVTEWELDNTIFQDIFNNDI